MTAQRRTARWLARHVGPPRFVVFLIMLAGGAGGWHLYRPLHGWQDCAVMGFDMAALLFLASLGPLLREASGPHGHAAMRARAARNDANTTLMLIITMILTMVVLTAITVELKGARSGHPLAIARLVGTLLITWLFGNSVFTLHYAHAFYAPTKPIAGKDGAATAHDDSSAWVGGLEFPATPRPGYGEFMYFAFTLGMTFQTSDVSVTTPAMRKRTLMHCFIAFIFNIGIIAFSINALGGLN